MTVKDNAHGPKFSFKAHDARLRGPVVEDRHPHQALLGGVGAQLSDAQLLGVVLRDVGPRAALAPHLLARFGALHQVLDAPPQMLLSVPRLGPGRVAVLKACAGLAGRAARRRLEERPVFQHKDDVALFLASELAAEQREVFAGMFLDARHRLLAFEKLFFGTVNRASVHPREIAKAALASNAAALIIAHNHPSGVAEPSPADVELTERLARLLGELEVRLLDHVVVGHDRVVSMAERGLL